MRGYLSFAWRRLIRSLAGFNDIVAASVIRATEVNVIVWFFCAGCLLVLLGFYPYGLSYEINLVLKQGIFVLWGLFSLALVLIFWFAGWGQKRDSFLSSLLLLGLISTISTLLSVRPLDSFLGLSFEWDSLAVIISFISIILAVPMVFKNYQTDVALFLINATGYLVILPSLILKLINGGSNGQSLFIDQTSLLVLSVMMITAVAFQFDFRSGLSITQRISLFLISLASLVALFLDINFLIIMIGVSSIAFLLCLNHLKGKTETSIPLVSVVVMLLFSVMLVVSLNGQHKTKIFEYWQNVVFMHKALEYAFQWDDLNYFFGSGPRSFTSFWDVYRPFESYHDATGTIDYEPPYVTPQPKYSFSFVLTQVINGGFMGLLSWSVFLFTALTLIKCRLQEGLDEYNQGSAVALPGLVFLLSIIFLSPEIQVVAVGGFMLGLLTLTNTKVYRLNSSDLTKATKLIAMVFILGLLTIAVVGWQRVWQTSLLFQKTADSWLIWDLAVGLPIDHSKEMLSVRPMPEYYRLLAQIQFDDARLRLSTNKTLNDSESETVKKSLADSVINASKAVQLNENDYRNFMVLADIHTFLYFLGANDSYEAAKENYDKTVTLINIHPWTYYGLARLELLRRDYLNATRNIDEALRVRPDWPYALELKDEIQETKANDISG